MIGQYLLKLRARDDVSAEEEAALRDAIAEYRDVADGTVLVREGQPINVSILLTEGLVCRYKDLRDGRRQISALHVAGDFLDLHGFTLKKLDHNVMALAPSKIALVPHEALNRITERYPHLTRLLWFSTNLDAAIHREWELSLGCRSAAARIGHLLCELHARMSVVEIADGLEFDLPMTQAEIAECVGLTPVHVNRTLRELREAGLVTFRTGRVQIVNLPALVKLSEFDPSYLYIEKQPR